MKKLYNLLIVCSFSIAMLLTYSNANARIEEGDCYVYRDCGDGSIYCSGESECSSSSSNGGSVTCDGKKTSC